MKKADPAQLLTQFQKLSDGLTGVTQKRMFGCDCFFKDKMIFGLVWKHGRIGLKFPNDADYDEAMALKGAGPWKAGPMAMSRWVLLPETFHADDGTLKKWIVRSHAQAGSAAGKSQKKPVAKKSKPAKRR